MLVFPCCCHSIFLWSAIVVVVLSFAIIMSSTNRYAFNSPPPKRFVQVWSPLIPGLQDSASWKSSDGKDEEQESSSLQVVAPVDCTQLREGSFAETLSSEDAKMIQFWLNSEEKKSSVDSKSPQADLAMGSPDKSHAWSPYANATIPSDTTPNLSTKVNLPDFDSLSIYEVPSPDSDASFSPIGASRDTQIRFTSERPVLADISKSSKVEFVPNSWLTLYHSRPLQDSDDHSKLAWLLDVASHFRGVESEEEITLALLEEAIAHNRSEGVTKPTPKVLSHEIVPKPTPNEFSHEMVPKPTPDAFSHEMVPNTSPGMLSHVMVPNTTLSKFSPLSMESASQSTFRPSRSNTHSVRSILKTSSPPGNSSGDMRGRLGVRFMDYPLTAVKRPAFLQQQATPTTWPNKIPQPRVPAGNTADLHFRDIWENRCPKATTVGWIPYETPESKLSNSSSSSSSAAGDSLSDTQSNTSKTTVILSGKENSLDESFSSTATKVGELDSVVKSAPSRLPFKAKKLDYERSSSERNILKGSSM